MMAAMVRASWRPPPSRPPCEVDLPFSMDGTSPSSSSSSSLSLSPRRGRPGLGSGSGSGSKPKKPPQRGLGVAQLERLRLKQQHEEELQQHLHQLQHRRRAAFPVSSLYSPVISPLQHHRHHPSSSSTVLPFFAANIQPFPSPPPYPCSSSHGGIAAANNYSDVHLSPSCLAGFPKPRPDAPSCSPAFQNPVALDRLYSPRNPAFQKHVSDHLSSNTAFQKPAPDGMPGNTAVPKPVLDHLYGNTAFQKPTSDSLPRNTTFQKPISDHLSGNTAFQKPTSKGLPGNTTVQKPISDYLSSNTAFQKPASDSVPSNTAVQKTISDHLSSNTAFQKPTSDSLSSNTTVQKPISDHLSHNTAFQKPTSDSLPSNTTFQKPISDHLSSNTAFQKPGSNSLPSNTTFQKPSSELRQPSDTAVQKPGLEGLIYSNTTFQKPVSEGLSCNTTVQELGAEYLSHDAAFQKSSSEGLSHNVTTAFQRPGIEGPPHSTAVEKLGPEGLSGNTAARESGSGGVSSDTANIIAAYVEQQARRHEENGSAIHQASKNSTFSLHLPDLRVSNDPNTPRYEIQGCWNPSQGTPIIGGFDGHQKLASGGLLGGIAIVSQRRDEEKGTFSLDPRSDSVSDGVLSTACQNPSCRSSGGGSNGNSAWVLAMPEADSSGHREPLLGFAAMDFQVAVEEAQPAAVLHLSEAGTIGRRSSSSFPMPSNVDQPCCSTTIAINSPKAISCMVARPMELSSFQNVTLQPPWPFEDNQVLRKKRPWIHIKEPPAEEETWDLNPNSTKAKKSGTHQIHKASVTSSSHKRALFPFDSDDGTFLALELSSSSSSSPSKSDQSTSQQIARILLQSSDSFSGMLSTEDDRFRLHHSSSNSEQMKSDDGASYLRTSGTIDLSVENMKDKCLMKYLWATQEEEEKPMMMVMQVDHMDLDLKLSLL